jgi:hypothetical protein
VSGRDVTIAGRRYAVRPAPALVSLHAAARIANTGAPALLGFLTGRGLDARLMGAISECLRDPSLGDNLEFLCRAFAPHTQVVEPDGRSFTLADKLDEHFAGRLEDLFSWLEAAVEVSLGSFLAGIGRRIGSAVLARKPSKEAADEASPSRSPEPSETSG